MTRVDPPTEPIEMPWQAFPELHTGDCYTYQWASPTFADDVEPEFLASHLAYVLDRTITDEGYDPADYGDRQWVVLPSDCFKPDLWTGRKFSEQGPWHGRGVVLAAVAIRTRNFAAVGRIPVARP